MVLVVTGWIKDPEPVVLRTPLELPQRTDAALTVAKEVGVDFAFAAAVAQSQVVVALGPKHLPVLEEDRFEVVEGLAGGETERNEGAVAGYGFGLEVGGPVLVRSQRDAGLLR